MMILPGHQLRPDHLLLRRGQGGQPDRRQVPRVPAAPAKRDPRSGTMVKEVTLLSWLSICVARRVRVFTTEWQFL